MSIKLMTAAWDIQVGSHAAKMVLMKLADNSNDEGVCWPSYANLADKCEMTRRSVMNQIDKLERMGLVSRGRRSQGDRNASNVFTVTLGGETDSPLVKDVHQGGETNSPGGGETNSPRTVRTGNRHENREIDDYKPDDVSHETWGDFVAHRKGIKRPLTVSAAKRLKRKLDELRKHGSDPEEVLNHSILNGWQGVFPVKSQNKQTNEPAPSSWYDRHDVVEY